MSDATKVVDSVLDRAEITSLRQYRKRARHAYRQLQTAYELARGQLWQRRAVHKKREQSYEYTVNNLLTDLATANHEAVEQEAEVDRLRHAILEFLRFYYESCDVNEQVEWGADRLRGVVEGKP